MNRQQRRRWWNQPWATITLDLIPVAIGVVIVWAISTVW